MSVVASLGDMPSCGSETSLRARSGQHQLEGDPHATQIKLPVAEIYIHPEIGCLSIPGLWLASSLDGLDYHPPPAFAHALRECWEAFVEREIRFIRLQPDSLVARAAVRSPLLIRPSLARRVLPFLDGLDYHPPPALAHALRDRRKAFVERGMRSIRLEPGFLVARTVVRLPLLVRPPLACCVLPLGVWRASAEQHATQQGYGADPLPGQTGTVGPP